MADELDTVIRENADHRAREEAEQQAHQEEVAAQQRKQDMHKWLEMLLEGVERAGPALIEPEGL